MKNTKTNNSYLAQLIGDTSAKKAAAKPEPKKPQERKKFFVVWLCQTDKTQLRNGKLTVNGKTIEGKFCHLTFGEKATTKAVLFVYKDGKAVVAKILFLNEGKHAVKGDSSKYQVYSAQVLEAKGKTSKFALRTAKSE